MARKVINQTPLSSDLKTISEFVSVRELIFEIQKTRKKSEEVIEVSDGNDGWTPTGNTGDFHVQERIEGIDYLLKYKVISKQKQVKKNGVIKFRLKINPKPFAALSKIIDESIEEDKRQRAKINPSSVQLSLRRQSKLGKSNPAPNRISLIHKPKPSIPCKLMPDAIRIGNQTHKLGRPEVRFLIQYAFEKTLSGESEISKHLAFRYLKNRRQCTIAQFSDVFRGKRHIWRALFQEASNNRHFRIKDEIQIVKPS
ncbi:MAG: hypothetical protein ACKVQC_05850 [Elusimicrobiota bacterium]